MSSRNKVSKQEAAKLVRTALSGDSTESRAVLKTLAKQRYYLGEHASKAILEELSARGSLYGCPNPDAFVRLLNLATFSKASNGYEKLYEHQVIEGMQHQSGQVRENARKTASNLPFVYGHDNEGKQKIKKLLQKIEELMQKYMPNNPPASLSRAAPSVYKTLCLTWYDIISMFHLHEELGYSQRAFDLDIPPMYSDEEEQTPEEADYGMQDWRNKIDAYFDIKDSAAVNRALKRREKASLEMLKWALEEVGEMDAYDRVVDLARSNDSFQLTRELMGMITKKVNMFTPQPGDEAIMTNYNKVARALQSVDNNVVLTGSNGMKFTRLMTALAEEEAYEIKRKIISLDEIIKGFDAAHTELDAIIRIIKKDHETMNRKLSKHGIPTYKLDLSEHKQISGYILDRLLQINRNIFSKKTPKQLAATAWSIMEHANNDASLTDTQLAGFAGWSNSSLSSFRSRMQAELAMNMEDPTILVMSDYAL